MKNVYITDIYILDCNVTPAYVWHDTYMNGRAALHLKASSVTSKLHLRRTQQCAAIYCNNTLCVCRDLQYPATHCHNHTILVLSFVTHCNALQQQCRALQHTTAPRTKTLCNKMLDLYNALQHVATKHSATHCNNTLCLPQVLQHTATQHTETTWFICLGSLSQKKPILVLLFWKRDLHVYTYINVYVHICICICTYM